MYSKIQEQLEVLNTKIRFFGRIKAKNHLEALDQISEFGTPYDVQYIIHHIFSDNKLISQKTATIIRNLLTKKEVKTAWLNLYSCFSGNYYTQGRVLIKKDFNSPLLNRFTDEEVAHLYGFS